jgi:hypothetical protein
MTPPLAADVNHPLFFDQCPGANVVLASGGGVFDESLSGFAAHLGAAFQAPHIPEHFAKLARAQADERHLFIPLHDSALPFSISSVTGVSVEFIRFKGADGGPVHELVGGAFVKVPSNPTARVLVSKAEFSHRLKAILAGQPDPVVTKAAGGDMALLQAAHDALVHLGAACVVEPVDDGTGADDGANKAAALRLRLKTLR